MVNLQEEKDLDDNVAVSARRFEESPFIARYDTSKMVRGVYAGRFFAVYAGEDYLEKYWLLRRRALIFDVPEKPVEISGPDAVPFLERLLTRRVSTMTEGRGYYALACTPQGGFLWMALSSNLPRIVSGMCRLMARLRPGCRFQRRF